MQNVTTKVEASRELSLNIFRSLERVGQSTFDSGVNRAVNFAREALCEADLVFSYTVDLNYSYALRHLDDARTSTIACIAEIRRAQPIRPECRAALLREVPRLEKLVMCFKEIRNYLVHSPEDLDTVGDANKVTAEVKTASPTVPSKREPFAWTEVFLRFFKKEFRDRVVRPNLVDLKADYYETIDKEPSLAQLIVIRIGFSFQASRLLTSLLFRDKTSWLKKLLPVWITAGLVRLGWAIKEGWNFFF